MLTCNNISKTFGDTHALQEVSLTLHEGSIFGLLGTNGAGKSTLLRILAGIYQGNGGEVLYNGTPVYDSPLCKQDICYLSDVPNYLYASTLLEMSAHEQAHYKNYSHEKLLTLCKHFDLPLNKSISTFSKGIQKCASLCLALARNPKVLLCDETFDGLDPVMREAFKRLINEETIDHNMLTVLAGHNQLEMENICDTVGLLHEGKVVAQGDISAILTGICKVQCAFETLPDASFFKALSPLHMSKQGKLCVLTVRGEQETLQTVLEKQKPLFMEFLPLSLEEIFILEMEEKNYVK